MPGARLGGEPARFLLATRSNFLDERVIGESEFLQSNSY